MGMGVSLLLIAVGAVLVWAVNATVSGIEIHTIGWILLAVGEAHAQVSSDERSAAFERRAQRLQLLRLEPQLGLQVVEGRRAGSGEVLEEGRPLGLALHP